MVQDVVTRAGQRALTPRSWAPDLVGAALVAAFLVFVTRQIPVEGDRPLDALGYALLVIAAASLALCRRRPLAALAVITAVLATYLVREYPGGPIFVTGWVALFAVSVGTDRRTAIAGGVGFCAVLGVAVALSDAADPLLHLLVLFGWSAAAVFLGDAMRSRRRYLAGLVERARYLERTREEEARRRVAEERLRIARDLHDSVAHAMATINVQAGAAAHVLGRRPEAAAEALQAIQHASRDVLDELAALIGLLREEDGALHRAPTPGLGEIEGLVGATRKARVPITMRADGPLDAVSRPVGTAAYRIVQESLTNVLRHAGASQVNVSLCAGADASLALEITDDGVGQNGSSLGAGMGIRGMRERAESTGGTVDVGPRPDGGFRVRATWPARR